MLTFLRKIRKSLIESGSAQKYMLYAIGEILLVMIGILLALQVNNWNEGRNDKIVQLRLLNELHATAGEDLERNQFHINRNEQCLASIRLLIDHIEKKLPYNDSLSHHFTMGHNRWISQLKDNAYDNIKIHGLDFIRNDTTRNQLTHLYENRIQFFDVLEERLSQFYYQVAAPVLVSRFEELYPAGSRGEMMTPLDYDALLSDKEYMTILKSTQNHMRQYINWQKLTILRGLEDLQVRLESEIEGY